MTDFAHKDLRATDIVAAVDTREQRPLGLLIPSVVKTLKCGDYSVVGLEDHICIERKSLPDLLMCVGRERERFEACIQRMRAYEVRAIVIEASWGTVNAGMWRSQLKPSQVTAALYSWIAHNITVELVGDPDNAARMVSGLLFSAARKRYRQLQAFLPELKIAGGT